MTNLPSLMALRCFDLSARHSSFTKAAQEVHLTQGAVSHQILGLEAQLGMMLFVRKRAGLELTAAGRAYWVEISAALRQIERATQNVVLNKGDGGALNLCVASSFATYWLMPRLAGFVGAHPEVTLNLSTHIGPVDFSTSPHDAAIEFCGGVEPGLCARLVLPLELRPYCAPSLLMRKGALAKLLSRVPLIRHTTVPLAWEYWLQHAGLEGAIPAQHLDGGPRYDLLSMALNGAIAGLGVALLPEYVAAGAVAARQIALVSNHAWASEKAYYLRYPEWKSDLIALRRFDQWLEGQ
ncbi:MAG: LysR family transcriptional regulator [Burkholderiales bacterium]|nr:LysR family transcriptional regulator [Burkholderiales bacterium]